MKVFHPKKLKYVIIGKAFPKNSKQINQLGPPILSSKCNNGPDHVTDTKACMEKACADPYEEAVKKSRYQSRKLDTASYHTDQRAVMDSDVISSKVSVGNVKSKVVDKMGVI